MIPIKDQLMAMIRDLGGTSNENDCRIPALLKQLNELLESEEPEQEQEQEPVVEDIPN